MLHRYWDSLNQINLDFLQSNRDVIKQCLYLNSDYISYGNELHEIYFNASFAYLVESLNNDIELLYVSLLNLAFQENRK